MLDDRAATADRIDRNSMHLSKSGARGCEPHVLTLRATDLAGAEEHHRSELPRPEEIQPETGTPPDADTTFEIGDGEFSYFEIDP